MARIICIDLVQETDIGDIFIKVHDLNSPDYVFQLRACLNIGTDKYTLYDDHNQIYDVVDCVGKDYFKTGNKLNVAQIIKENP